MLDLHMATVPGDKLAMTRIHLEQEMETGLKLFASFVLRSILSALTHQSSQRTLHLLKGHFFLGFHCPARCLIDKYRISKIIDVDYWYCWGVTIPDNVH